jgi:hypothetical protein
MLVRQRIHQEIRIYIDALTTQQSNLNAHFIRALTGVVDGLDGFGLTLLRRQQQSQAETLENLQGEVERLRAEVERLRALVEATVDGRPNGATRVGDA